jgi:hypothetical protein
MDSKPPRLTLAYADGSWTDRLAAQRLGVHTEGSRIELVIELVPRPGSHGKASAVRALDFLARERHLLDVIQIAPPRAASRLKAELRRTENVAIGLRLVTPDFEAVYPASVTFGPDAVTLSIG